MPVPESRQAALEYLHRVPKVELHVHLEGAIGRDRLFGILRRHGQSPELSTASDLDFLYKQADFADFLDHFRFAVTKLRDTQDVHDVARDLFESLVAQNVRYAEVIFSAAIFTRAGMPLAELLDCVMEAEAVVLRPDANPPRRYNLVIDVVRNFGPESALRLVEELAHLGHPRVVGIHLGGDEVRFPARLFEAAFHEARRAGFGLAAHAGEADGPESVRDAVLRLGARRIGHGVRSLEDPALLQELVRHGVTLEVCPTSNVCTGLVARLEAHPLPALLRHGVAVTLGSDDPSYFGTDLEHEMRAVYLQLGLDLRTLDRMNDAGLRAAFLSEAERGRWLEHFASERRDLRLELGLQEDA